MNNYFRKILSEIHVFSRDERWICYHKGTNKIIELEEDEAKKLLELQNGGKCPNLKDCQQVLSDLSSIIGETFDELIPMQPINTFYLKFNNCCNLSCGYCRINKTRDTKECLLSEETAVRAVSVMKALGAKGVGIHGGEPMMEAEHLKCIISAIRAYDADFAIGLTCNGTLVDEKLAKFLSEKQVLVSVELDGSKDTHDQYKRYNNGKSSFDDAVRGASILKKHNVLTAIESTISGKNGYDVTEYRKLSQTFPNTPVVVARIKSADPGLQEDVSHGETLFSFLDSQLKSLDEKDNIFNDAVAGIINLQHSPCISKYRCNCLLDKVSVNLDGTVYICPKIEDSCTVIGNINDKDFIANFSKNRENAANYFVANELSSKWYSNLLEFCVDIIYRDFNGTYHLQDKEWIERYFEDLIYKSATMDSYNLVNKWQHFGF